MIPVGTPPPVRPSPVQSTGVQEVHPVAADDQPAMPLPGNPQTFFLGCLFLFAMLSMFYLASAIVLPVVLAFVLMLLLQPAVRLLERVHLPRVLGALLVILLVIGALVGLIATLSAPAAT